jgi:hypothetical protein
MYHELVLCPLNALDVYSLLHHLPEGAHLPQLGHMLYSQIHRTINLRLCTK